MRVLPLHVITESLGDDVKCLGSGTYSAQIRVVGTGEIVEEIATNEIISGTWNRLTNRTSKCTLSLPVMGTSSDKCCRFVGVVGLKLVLCFAVLLINQGQGGNYHEWWVYRRCWYCGNLQLNY